MGSGKGRTRRVRAATASAGNKTKIVRFRVTPWDEFLKSTGVGLIEISQYYLNKTLQGQKWNRPNLTDVECEQILTGLFADAVAVGALAVPRPYSIDDFRFEVRAAHTKQIG